ncbi:MAG: NAD-dependent epimerase/dehydratase family protein, partial [Candidatus Hodarchaeota archaeon]
MFALLTGSFGNIGESTLLALLDKGHSVRCFDLKTDATQKKQKSLRKLGKFETAWGDITDAEAVRNAVEGVDCIIHLAA